MSQNLKNNVESIDFKALADTINETGKILGRVMSKTIDAVSQTINDFCKSFKKEDQILKLVKAQSLANKYPNSVYYKKISKITKNKVKLLKRRYKNGN